MTKQEKCPIIFLDMDGVIADFMQAALKEHFGDRWQQHLRDWPKGKYESYGHMGLTVNQFWEKINAIGPDFWADLPTFSWTEDLIDMCREFGMICLLSSPSQHPDCVSGKLRWIKRVLGKGFKDYVFVPKRHKRLLAGPDRYLIEDSEQNANEFVEAGGGGAIVIPQPWNNYPERSLDLVGAVRQKLEGLLCRVK